MNKSDILCYLDLVKRKISDFEECKYSCSLLELEDENVNAITINFYLKSEEDVVSGFISDISETSILIQKAEWFEEEENVLALNLSPLYLKLIDIADIYLIEVEY